MAHKRKIALAVRHVLKEDEDHLDVEFWLSKSPSERLAEVVRLRRLHFTSFGKTFPGKIEKVVFRRKLR
ncbi:MAG: hypothetical protein JWQ57_450 [Mucilaginibacter sp.]|nr:hypothetical protein [Mucilaginibacter sp.]